MSSGMNDRPPYHNVGPYLLAESYILLAITFALLAVRFYVAMRITHIFDAADVTILISTAFLVANVAFSHLAIEHGMGQTLAYIKDSEHQALQVRKYNTFIQITNVCTTLFTKYSIGFYILRIKRDRVLKTVLGILMLPMTLAAIACVVVLAMSCVPLKTLWDPAVHGSCLSLSAVYISTYVQSAFTIISDLGLTIFPIVILWNVQIRPRQKIFIILLMSLGLIATASNAARNAFTTGLTDPDFTWTMVPIFLLASAEVFAGIIAACIPPCVPLVTRRKIKKQNASTGIYYSTSYSIKDCPARQSNEGPLYHCVISSEAHSLPIRE